MTVWWRKLSAWFRRGQIAAELREEIETHLEMKASAMDDPRAARLQFGNAALLLEDSRAAWGWPQLEAWARDLRYALRNFARRPTFTATVALTLALGIGASSTIFSLIDTILIRPLPYPDSGRLVALNEVRMAERAGIAPGRLEDWQRLNTAFEGLAGAYSDTLTETSGPLAERISGAYVSQRFFSVLGTPPELGRTFTTQEEEFGGPLAIVISDGLWRRRFSADPAVLGRVLVLAGQNHPIVGVMPPSFQYPASATELWAPKQARPGLLKIREARFYGGIGRLKPGRSLEQAHADLAAIQRRLGEQYPATDAGWGVAIEPLKDRLVGRVRPALWLLLGSVSVLLLIACANVACLLLARLSGRTAEIATRLSLGAGRIALARQLLAEGLVYALAGGLLGIGGAFAGIDFLRKRLPDIPRITELSVDPRMLAIGIGVSVLAAMVCSLAPIGETFRADLAAMLTPGGRGGTGGRQRFPRFLVAGQLALATALLIGAGLLLQSLLRLQGAPLGFRPEGVLTFRVSASFSEPGDAVVQRHQRTLEALAALPGVTATAMSNGLPGVDPVAPREFEIVGRPALEGAQPFAAWRFVTSGYFQTAGIPMLAGRSCRMSAAPQTPFEAVVNQSFARRYFPGLDPIGRTIRRGPQIEDALRIVGVAADAREDGQGREPQPAIYGCGYLRFWPDSNFLVRAANPEALAGAVRRVMAKLEPARPVYSIRPLEDALSGALSATRVRTLLVALFSMLALTLAAVGLYGVMAYSVAQRRREIGIRVALGARPGQIVGEILRSGAALSGAGVAAGLVLAAAAASQVQPLLYGIRPSDLMTHLSAAGVLFAVALLACLIPSKRATSIDPAVTLRES